VQPLATFIFREERGKWKEIEKCIDLWIDLIEPQWRVSISGCQGSEGPDTHGQHHQNCTGWPCFLIVERPRKLRRIVLESKIEKQILNPSTIIHTVPQQHFSGFYLAWIIWGAVALQKDPRVCISNNLPGDADAASVWARFSVYQW
jgi:hypothetical protein